MLQLVTLSTRSLILARKLCKYHGGFETSEEVSSYIRRCVSICLPGLSANRLGITVGFHFYSQRVGRWLGHSVRVSTSQCAAYLCPPTVIAVAARALTETETRTQPSESRTSRVGRPCQLILSDRRISYRENVRIFLRKTNPVSFCCNNDRRYARQIVFRARF